MFPAQLQRKRVHLQRNQKNFHIVGLTLALLLGCWMILVFRVQLEVVPPKLDGDSIVRSSLYNDPPLRTKKVIKNSNQRTTPLVPSHYQRVSTSTGDGAVQPAPFKEDILCRGCRHAIADENDPESERCGVYIHQEFERLLLQHQQQQQDKDTRLLERKAAATISQRYPKGCKACRPSGLNSNSNEHAVACNNRFWRYDAAAPAVAGSVERETWLAASLPSRHRLSAAATQNVTAYFMDPKHVYPASEYFMEYNPSLVVLPPRQAHSLLGGRADNNQYYYVASFRVSNQHYCFRPADRQHMAGGSSTQKSAQVGRDYLGLAVLNSKFEVALDTIVDLKQAAGFVGAQDFRLFVLPHNDAKNANDNQLYISSNDLIAPIQLTLSNKSQDAAVFEKDNYQLVPRAFDINSNNQQPQLQVWVRSYPSCAPCSRKRGFCGKNFNYFVDDSNNKVMVEIWPTGPHTVRGVDLNGPCRRGLPAAETFVDTDHGVVLPARATVEEVDVSVLRRYESILTRGRGSACCVRYNNSRLLLGIQHSKTPSQNNRRLPGNLTSNHYLSSFYAFEPVDPYRVVAQSAWFCLGFPPNPTSLAKVASWRKLIMGNSEVFACPRIHFVSGITLAPDDPTTVLVAYGINDCVSRFVRIRLSDVFFGDFD